jgi:hypothetical protein
MESLGTKQARQQNVFGPDSQSLSLSHLFGLRSLASAGMN